MRALQINAANGVLSDLEILDVYEFLDRPILFSAVDSEGILFISTWSNEFEEGVEEWIYSPISKDTLLKLRSGEIDFHVAFLDNSYDYAFRVIENWNEKTSQVSVIRKRDIIPDSLPDIGEGLSEEEASKFKDIGVPSTYGKINLKIDREINYNNRTIRVVGVPAYKIDDSISIGNIATALLDDFFGQIHIDFPNDNVDWSDIADLGNADFEFRFSGRKTIPNRWSLKAINQSSERIITGLRLLIEKEEEISDITVPYLKAGSIIYGISSRSSDTLIGEKEIGVYEALKDIRKVSEWVEVGGNRPDIPDARLRDVLRAIEEMAPHERDDFSQLELIPKADSINSGVRQFNLTYRSRISASERLQIINLRERETRIVKFQGNIDRIKKPSRRRDLGSFHMIELSTRPDDWTSNTVTIKFDVAKLVDSLLAFTASSAQVTAIQSYVAGRWDTNDLHLIAIKSIEEDFQKTHK